MFATDDAARTLLKAASHGLRCDRWMRALPASFENQQRMVIVIHPDDGERDRIAAIIESHGMQTRRYGDISSFVAEQSSDRGCVFFTLAGTSSLEELSGQIASLPSTMPRIALSKDGNIPHAVLALQMGAVTVLESTFRDDALRRAVEDGLEREAEFFEHFRQLVVYRQRRGQLTTMEEQVLTRIMAGKSNAMIGQELVVPIDDVAAWQTSILQKFAVDSLAQLVREVTLAEQAMTLFC